MRQDAMFDVMREARSAKSRARPRAAEAFAMRRAQTVMRA